MIRNKLLIATAITGAFLITACSDVTAPQQFVPAGGPAAALLTSPCPAPGTGLPGAFNMIHDATMFDIPMANNAPQGTAGMFHAVGVSGCSPASTP